MRDAMVCAMRGGPGTSHRHAAEVASLLTGSLTFGSLKLLRQTAAEDDGKHASPQTTVCVQIGQVPTFCATPSSQVIIPQ